VKRKIKYYRLVWLKYDLPAGLSVFLVALPLCLGIAYISNAPIYAGILSGVIGGIVVSLISGSAMSVSGPAAGLSTVIAAAILSHGDYRVFLLCVIVAGIFQLLLGVLKLGFITNYIPSSVIKGMLAAIGILLISKQIPVALGYNKPDFWQSGFLDLFTTNDFLTNINEFNHHVTRGVVIITLFSIGAYWLFSNTSLIKIKSIPVPLIIVIIGIVLYLIQFYYVDEGAVKPSQLVTIPDNMFAQLQFPKFSMLFTSVKVWKDGITIGLLATLETLLCVEAVDKLDKHNRITPINRELIAQGVGNILCGMVGAIPITAVVVRGSANINAGARTKLSAFTHGVFLLLSVLFIPFILNLIPLASLAVILIITGYNLTKVSLFKNMFKLGWEQFIPFVATILVILFTDLLLGVSIGLLISVYFIIQHNFTEQYKVEDKFEDGHKIIRIFLNTNVSFLNKVKLRDTLDNIPEGSRLLIDGKNCRFIDYDILEIISEYEVKAKDRHITMQLEGIQRVETAAMH